eukprot:COSAG01_NODE_312_length_19063_cov_207.879825_2_plen_46_part_00
MPSGAAEAEGDERQVRGGGVTYFMRRIDAEISGTVGESQPLLRFL